MLIIEPLLNRADFWNLLHDLLYNAIKFISPWRSGDLGTHIETTSLTSVEVGLFL